MTHTCGESHGQFYGSVSDRVIASQTDPWWSQSAEFDLVERFVLESGRSVSVVPNSLSSPGTGCETARAVFDALPALKTASHIAVIRVAEALRKVPDEIDPATNCTTL